MRSKCYHIAMIEDIKARKAVKIALAQRDMSLTDLAKRLGTHTSTLSRLLSEDQAMNARSLWPRIFEELGIEVIYRVK